MGREIRKVPPNWEHPKDAHGRYVPLSDVDYETAAASWAAGYEQWRAGTHPAQQGEFGSKEWFWEYDSPPSSETCRPKFLEPATWFQVYETVSEGTPTTPPFATASELIDHLVQHGEFGERDGWPRKSAEHLVSGGYVPSLIVDANGIHLPRDQR